VNASPSLRHDPWIGAPISFGIDGRCAILRHAPSAPHRGGARARRRRMTTAPEIEVRLARTQAEVEAAQRLRYRVFYDEWGAHPDGRQQMARRDMDRFDAAMDHLVVIDHSRPPAAGQVVGNYRLQLGNRLGSGGRFYSSGEYDLRVLADRHGRMLEMGRSCVLREYRHRSILQRLWRAIVAYAGENGIELIFGCASLRGTDPHAVREQLAYLHHYHVAPAHLRPRAYGPNRIEMDTLARADIDVPRARDSLEPLIRGYLRQGASVGDGAYLDREFNAIDVFMLMPTEQLAAQHQRLYARAQAAGVAARARADREEAWDGARTAHGS
jgi:putative hemolysin